MTHQTYAFRSGRGVLPEAVRVPSENVLTWYTTGTDELTYECRENKDMAG